MANINTTLYIRGVLLIMASASIMAGSKAGTPILLK